LVSILRVAWFLLFVTADASTILGFNSDALKSQQVDHGRLETSRPVELSIRARMLQLLVSDFRYYYHPQLSPPELSFRFSKLRFTSALRSGKLAATIARAIWMATSMLIAGPKYVRDLHESNATHHDTQRKDGHEGASLTQSHLAQREHERNGKKENTQISDTVAHSSRVTVHS
jgi:hypothetical protein